VDEDELRRQVRDALGEDLPDPLWKLLRQDGYLNVQSEAELSDLVDRATTLRQLFSSRPMQSQRRRAQPGSHERFLAPRLTKNEALRERALAEYFAKEASGLPEVERFRSEVLGGELLSEEEAERFLDSPALRMFPLKMLLDEEVPIRQHTAEIVEQQGGRRSGRYRATVRVTPPGAEIVLRASNLRDPVYSAREGTGTRFSKVWAKESYPIQVHYWPGSVIAELMDAAGAVERHDYERWERHAAWFILTGVIPRRMALTTSVTMTMRSHSRRAHVTVRAEPWVSASSVLAMYRQSQKDLLGRHNRPLSERRLQLFRFVTASSEPGERPHWRPLMQRWNRRFRRWQYSDARNFSRDYWMTARQLLFSRYRMAGVVARVASAPDEQTGTEIDGDDSADTDERSIDD
jgi:hypothetical protein